MKTLAFISMLPVMAFLSPVNAQRHVPWTKEDSVAINALVLYPDTVRAEIFEACEYPAIIVRVADLQKSSSATFTGIINGYSKKEEEDIWNLSRYPGLISKLSKSDSKSDAEINAILADYPTDTHDDGLKYAKNYHPALTRIDSLESATNKEFEQTISYYPSDVQQTFRDLLKYPEVLSLLNEHLSLTVRVGDHYKRDPAWVLHKADSNYMVQVRENAQELQEWRETIEKDSDARKDLEQAANAYADSNGYKTADVDKPRDSNVVNNYYCYPYTYWFGYPSWYPYAYWYPYPYWYDWGFYYGPYGHIVVFGLPSFYFMNWYFYYPWHWHHHPHLGSVFIHHYYGYHHRYNSNSLLVHRWVQDNRTYLPRNFITSGTTRVNAVREIGQLHENTGIHATEAVRNQYLQKNSARFPTLNTKPAQSIVPNEGQVPNLGQRPQRQPLVSPRMQPNQRAAQPPSRNFNNFNRAQEQHRSFWNNSQPSRIPGQRTPPITPRFNQQRSIPRSSPPRSNTPRFNVPRPSVPRSNIPSKR